MARDCGHDGPPFRWDAARRFLLRCELIAAFFHLYGLGPDDTAHVLDTFPVVRKRDEAAHGSDRTAHTILDLHSRLTAATASSTPDVSPLHPTPANPGPTHPDRPASG